MCKVLFKLIHMLRCPGYSIILYHRLTIALDFSYLCVTKIHTMFAPTAMTYLCSSPFHFFSQLHDFWRLDYWEDDLRRRRRFVRNAFGSTHADVSLKALEDYGA